MDYALVLAAYSESLLHTADLRLGHVRSGGRYVLLQAYEAPHKSSHTLYAADHDFLGAIVSTATCMIQVLRDALILY